VLIYALAIVASTLLAWLSNFFASIKPIGVWSASLKKSAPLFLLFSFLILFLLSGFRVDVGIDYLSYIRIFWEYIDWHQAAHLEPGFRLIFSIIESTTMNPQHIFVISSFITLGGIFWSIKKHSVSPALSVYLFCTMGFLSHSFNLTRQFIAISIVLVSLKYLLNKQVIKYIVTVFIASLFHQTALLMVPAYLLLNHKFTRRQYVLTICIASVVMLLGASITHILVQQFYPSYDGASFVSQNIISPYYIVLCATLALGAIYLKRIGKLSLDKPMNRLSANIIFVTLIFHALLFWVPLSNRVSLYFDIILIIVIPHVISQFPNKVMRRVLTVGAIIYFGLFAYSSFSSNSNQVLPYNSSLFSYYEQRRVYSAAPGHIQHTPLSLCVIKVSS